MYKYVCVDCEYDEPCVLKIATKANNRPNCCPWEKLHRADWIELGQQPTAQTDAVGTNGCKATSNMEE